MQLESILTYLIENEFFQSIMSNHYNMVILIENFIKTNVVIDKSQSFLKDYIKYSIKLCCKVFDNLKHLSDKLE